MAEEKAHSLTILIKGDNKASKPLEEAGKSVADLGKLINALGSSIALKFAVATEVLRTLVDGIKDLTKALINGLAAITDYAIGLEGMRAAFWGIAGEAGPAMLQSLRENSAFMLSEKRLLRSYNEAYMLVGRTLADRMPEAYRYMIKVASATGEDADYLMQRMYRSVGRLSTRWMAYVGTVVSLEEATAAACVMFGKTADELTREEKQAAMLDRVLAKLEARTAALPDVTTTARQAVDAFRASMKDLWGDLGTHFLPVVRSLFIGLHKIVQAFRSLISEGGALYGPIRKISAAFSVLFDIIGELVDRITGAEKSILDNLGTFADAMVSLAWKAFEWGANIIVNFAAGMVRGAADALAGAMDFISGILRAWLAPGSAPKIVAGILGWGAAAFTEFLKGFSMAQFDVLEGVQRPLKRALSVLVRLDELAPEVAGQAFIDLTYAMTEALEQFERTGQVTGEIFEELSAVGGEYGEALAELFRRQLGLATAVKELAAAEERLNIARKAEEQANKRLSKSAREYNKLVRLGADPAVLKAKLAEVEASYDSLVAAREETEQAEAAQEAAQEAVKRQQEQVRLQERLLAQLLEIGQAMADIAAAAAGVGVGEDGYEIPPIEWPDIYPQPIDEAFEALKESIRKKFEELWAELRKQWEESGVYEAVARLQTAWENLWEALKPIREWLGDLWTTFSDWAQDKAWPWILEQWDKWKDWWAEHGPEIVRDMKKIGAVVSGWVKDAAWPWILEQWDKWKDWWAEHGPEIVRDMKKIGAVVSGWVKDAAWPWVLKQCNKWKDWWEEKSPIIREKLEEIGDIIRGWVKEHVWEWAIEEWDKWKLWWEEDGPSIKEAFDNLLGSAGRLIDKIIKKGGLTEAFDKLRTASSELVRWFKEDSLDWEAIWESMTTAADEAVDDIQLIASGMTTDLRETISLSADLINGDWEGAWEHFQEIGRTNFDTLDQLFDGRLSDLRSLVAASVEDPAGFLQSGKDIVKNLWEGIVFKWGNLDYDLAVKLDSLAGLVYDRLYKLWDAGKAIIVSLSNGIRDNAEKVREALKKVIDDAIEAIKRALGLSSPSKVFTEMGMGVVEGFTKGIEAMEKTPTLAIQRALDLTVTAAATAPGAGASRPPVVINNYFGRDSVRSDRDVYLLAEQIQRSMTLRGARELVS